MEDSYDLLHYKVTDIVVAGVDMSGLPRDLRSVGEIDGRLVVLEDNGRVKLGKPDFSKELAEVDEAFGAFG